MGVIGRKTPGTKAESPPFKRTGILTPCAVHEIEKMLAEHWGIRQNLVVPNVSWGFFATHEADLVVITKSGYLTEIEIKRSWTDFLADFKKDFYHADDRIAQFFYAVPECMVVPCLEYIDRKKEEGPEFFKGRIPGVVLYRTPDESKYRRVEVARLPSATRKHETVKLTEKEISAIARLGTLRYWSLLDKLAAAEKKLNAPGPKGEVARLQEKIDRLSFLLGEVKASYREDTGVDWEPDF